MQDEKTITVDKRDANDHSLGKITVSTDMEKDGSDFANVKLCNLDYFEHDTGGRGGVDDLISLTHLHEPAILDVLALRYKNDTIYTYTGPILLAVNPFQMLPLYTPDVLQEYYETGLLRAQGIDTRPLPPHVFATADTAYRSMTTDIGFGDRSNRNQSVLVSGESGAGKTETTKHIMQYLATVGRPKVSAGAAIRGHHYADRRRESSADRRNSFAGAIPDGPVKPPVEKRVLDSNPILEAFGNAKTTRNENSSRFGKFIALQFNTRGELVGAKIETYLLEKVRIVTQAKDERNYHIFYQFFAGIQDAVKSALSDADLFGAPNRDRWKLTKPEDYNFINQSGCYTLRGVSDSDEFNATRSAMNTMGISAAAQTGIFDALAGVLHLSNVVFEDASGNIAGPGKPLTVAASKSASGDKPPAFVSTCLDSVNAACELLGVTPDGLHQALTSRELRIAGEVTKTYFSLPQAAATVEAVAKAIYSRLFLWIVSAVNRQIRAEETPDLSFIGVLDIFGFESFVVNSFEQLCINYTNETLQQQFNSFVFKLEQAEYQREEINWSDVAFPDNKEVLDLIESKRPPGILALLDEQCLLQSGSDEKFANETYKSLGNHPRLSASSKQKVALQFTVSHYAGDVVYSTQGFVEKNRDAIHKEATDLFVNSTHPVIRAFFANPNVWGTNSDTCDEFGIDAALVVQEQARLEEEASNVSKGGRGGKSTGLMSETVGTQFKRQLNSLMEVVKATQPHYVRCLKPNNKQVPKEFVRSEIVSQLRCNGVLEAVRVSRLGFPVRSAHLDFIRVYACLTTGMNIKKIREGDAKKAVMQLLESPELAALELGANVQVGLTKVFLRREAHDKLEAVRQAKQKAAIIRIQSLIKAHQQQQRYKKFRNAIISLQTHFRAKLAIRRVIALRREKAATFIQSFLRGRLARIRYVRFLRAVIAMQSRKRAEEARKKYLALRKERAILAIQSTFRMFLVYRKTTLLRNKVIAIQRWYRERKYIRLQAKRRREARDITKFKAEAENLRMQYELLESENATLKAKAEEMKEVSVRVHELEAKVAEMDSLAAEVEELKTGLQSASEVKTKLENEISSLKKTLGSTNEASQGWKQLVERLSGGRINALDEEHVEAGIAEMEAEKKKLVDQAATAAAATAAAAEAKRQAEALEKAQAEANERAELSAAESASAAAQAEAAKKDVEITELKAKMGALEQELFDIKSDNEKLTRKLEAARTENKGAKGEVDTLKETITSLESELSSSKEALASIRNELSTAKSAATSKVGELAGLNSKLSQAIEEKTAADEEIKKLKSMLEERNKQVANLQANQSTKASSMELIESLTETSKKQQTEITRLNNELAVWQKQVEAAHKENLISQQNANNAGLEIVRLKQKVSQLEAEREQWTKNASAKTGTDKELREQRAKNAVLEKDLANSKAQILELIHRSEQYLRTIEDNKQVIKEKQRELVAKDHEMGFLHERRVMDHDIKSALAQRLDSAIMEKQELNSHCKNLQKEIEVLNETIRRLTAERDSFRRGNESAVMHLADVSSKFGDQVANRGNAGALGKGARPPVDGSPTSGSAGIFSTVTNAARTVANTSVAFGANLLGAQKGGKPELGAARPAQPSNGANVNPSGTPGGVLASNLADNKKLQEAAAASRNEAKKAMASLPTNPST